jgi:hypothetical protein
MFIIFISGFSFIKEKLDQIDLPYKRHALKRHYTQYYLHEGNLSKYERNSIHKDIDN